jgi:hypothetical protein
MKGLLDRPIAHRIIFGLLSQRQGKSQKPLLPGLPALYSDRQTGES